MTDLISKLRMLKFNDLLSILYFLLAIPFALIFKLRRKDLWLICESDNEARDNGYWLFKYLIENNCKCYPVYAVKKKSADYKKVKDLGKVVEYGGLTHWIYYLAARVNISSQKGGKPNAALCYFLEISGLLKNKRVFLQHGITLSNAKWLYYKHTKMRLFICGCLPEYKYVKDNFGYPRDYVKYIGFCRFDQLHDFKIKKNQILVMPSWREWLSYNTIARDKFNYSGDFRTSKYYNYWNSFLHSQELGDLLEETDCYIIFYPHRNMQPFLKEFSVKNNRIKLASATEYDVQELLKESQLLITDYSSVCMDFSYMQKPVLYYQFDLHEFREGQYEKGYFDYEKDGFGRVAFNESELISFLKAEIDNQFELSDAYKDRIRDFFVINDTKNCERTYNEILKIAR